MCRSKAGYGLRIRRMKGGRSLLECAVKIFGVGDTITVAVPFETSVFAALVSAGVISHIETPCGGHGMCGKCLVKVTGRVSPAEPDELYWLGDKHERGFRLACCCYIKGDVSVVLSPREMPEAVESTKQPNDARYGFAIDVGTTTVNINLYNLDTKKRISGSEILNTQRCFGYDVISRIAVADKQGSMRSVLLSAVNAEILKLLSAADIKKQSVSEIIIVGNTCMQHIIANVDISPLGRTPFTPLTKDTMTFEAAEMGLMLPEATVTVMGVISGFVGADAIAAVLFAGIQKSHNPVLLVDFGTNAEIALGNRNVLFTCSSAAGPAFEGAGLSCGRTATNGAIYRVWREKYAIKYKTIGGAEAVGICGSGALDAVRVMLESKLIDQSGRFLPLEQIKQSKRRMLGTVDGQTVFYISRSKNIYITQKDIRAMQLAKAAIAAGIKTLFEELGIDDQSIDNISAVYVTGSFGETIDLESAVSIGLLPRKLVPITFQLSAAAAGGAGLLLLSPRARGEAEHIRTSARTLELSGEKFNDRFVDEIPFKRW